MKRITLLTLTLFLVLFGTSCTPKEDNTPDTPTLTLSANSITFGKEAQMPTTPQVTILTNQDSWYANTSADWLDLKEVADGLLISASENTMGKERSAKIYVQVSGKQDVIMVTQSSADIILGFTPKEALFEQIGGEKIVLVKTNLESWTLEALDENLDSWLSITANEEKGILLLNATENDTPNDREGKIFAKSDDGATTELVVRQKGIKQYFLPWYEKNFNSYRLISFEKNRGHILTNHTEPSDSYFGPQPGFVTFVNNSDVFPSHTYIYSLNNGLPYDMCQMICTDISELSEKGGFIQWLLEQGYTMRDNSTIDEPRYENEDHSMFMNIKWIKDKTTDAIIGAQVNFLPQVIQDKEMPTFSQLPIGPDNYLDLLRNAEVKPTDIEAFEKKHNGVLAEGGKITNPSDGYKDEVFYLVYNIKNVDKDYDANFRFYQFYIHFDNPNFLKPESENLYQSVAYGYMGFTDIDRGLFFVADGQFKITIELQALLKANGYKFAYIGTGGDTGFTYYNPSEKRVLTIQLWSDPLINGGTHTLVFRYHNGEMNLPTYSTLSSKTFEDMKSGEMNSYIVNEVYQPQIARVINKAFPRK